MVGARGLEPPTSASRTLRASHLRHAPTEARPRVADGEEHRSYQPMRAGSIVTDARGRHQATAGMDAWGAGQGMLFMFPSNGMTMADNDPVPGKLEQLPPPSL